MIRLGWFCPVSTRTGIAHYARGVLEQLRRLAPPGQLEVVVFHPPTEDPPVPMPWPCIALDQGLLGSDFHALFDLAIYHLGNNEPHHGPIYAALLRHPGIVVLHDHVYHHYLAGVSRRQGRFAPGLGALIHEAGGPAAFDFLADSGMLSRRAGAPRFIPWEEHWATTVPLGNLLAQLGSAAVVHSAYAEAGLGPGFAGPVRRLFMPRPEPAGEPPPAGTGSTGGGRIHLVCAGHIGPTKGLRLLVDAFALDPALSGRFRVSIAGFGSAPAFLEELRERIRSRGQEQAFELVVDPDAAAFAAVLAAADLFYNLRYPNTEGASLSLAEQLAHRRPVIAYRSGCFAEIPEAAGYFLDRVEDAGELAALLDRIAADRANFPARGAAAWEAVREQTAARYAQDLLAWIIENRALLMRRAALTRARAGGRLPAPAPEDAGWFRDLAAARRRFQDFYAGRLLLPSGLEAGDLTAQARYLLLNLLHREADDATLDEVAAVLAGLAPLARIRLFGELILLTGAQDAASPAGLPAAARCHLRPGSADLWRILLLLDPDLAIPAALELLGLAGPPESGTDSDSGANSGLDPEAGPGADVRVAPGAASGTDVRAVITDARRGSNALALAAALRAARGAVGFEPAQDPELAAITALIEAEATRRPLKAIGPGAEILALLRGPGARDRIALGGFHAVEADGIWTSTTEATLRLRLLPGRAAGALETRLKTLAPDAPVRIEVCEEATGRRAATVVPGAAGAQAVRLPLPEFSGVLCITVRTGAVRSPAERGLSDDARKLGVRLLELRLPDGAAAAPEGPRPPPAPALPAGQAPDPGPGPA